MNQKIAVSVVYVAAMFMTIMDTTIVNVALPTLGRQFRVQTDAVDTVAIGFLVSLAVFIPVSGWLGDRLGGRRVLLGSILIFTVASALCGQATSLSELVAFRVLQGVGGGLMTPVGMAMLFRTFPPHERVRASSILTVPTAFAPAAGPVVGGLLVTDASWRWVFYVNVPIGAVALAFGLLFLEGHAHEDAAGRFDLTGFVLAGAGFGAFMYAVSEGPIRGWSTTTVLVTLAAGLALIAAMVAVELRRRAPMVDLRIFSDRSFRAASLVMLLSGVSFLGVLYGLALFYQDGLGLSALGSGLSTFPEAVGVMVGVQLLTRRLYSGLGPRRLMAAGLVVTAVAMALLSQVDGTADLWWSRGFVFLMGFGMAGVFVPAQAVAFATVPAATTARASTLFNAQRQLGNALGVGLLTTVIAAVGPFHHTASGLRPDLGSYHAAFVFAAVVALLGAVAALTVRDADVASTMSPGSAGATKPVIEAA